MQIKDVFIFILRVFKAGLEVVEEIPGLLRGISGTAKGILGAFEDVQVLVTEFRDSFRGFERCLQGF